MYYRPLLRLLVAFASVIPLAAATTALPVERATYSSEGALASVIHEDVELPVRGALYVEFVGGLRENLQSGGPKASLFRDGPGGRWHGVVSFPNGTQAAVATGWKESPEGLAFECEVTSGSPATREGVPYRRPLDLNVLEYVIDLPRAAFSGGRLEPGAVALPAAKPAAPLLELTTDRLVVSDASRGRSLALRFDQARSVSVSDVWDDKGRSYRIRIPLHKGLWRAGDTQKLAFTLKYADTAPTRSANVRISADRALAPFDGFGGNYCFDNLSPVAAYTLDNLALSWARCEFKAMRWEREKNAPGPELQRDFEVIQRIHQNRIPWVLALWRLPERFYTDANQKTPGTFARKIAPEHWDEFVQLLTSYIQHVKEKYGAEPDLFAFNEPDLGVYTGLTPETHRDAIKKLGGEFARRGFKTKLVLGDTANARDTHRYVLATASDPAAMEYVGAVAFHSWGGATAEQYKAWRDVAEWLQRPLLVAEAGVDPLSYMNAAYDSYAYGLREAAQYQEMLEHAQPRSILYWEFTGDYSLVRVDREGAIRPTGRFALMKHFTNLTPRASQLVGAGTDQPDIRASAFVKEAAVVAHLLNTGTRCSATIEGLPPGDYDVITTGETEWLQQSGKLTSAGGSAKLELKGRSLTTLVRRGTR